ncbi:hypothetical protein CSUI_005529 [Cystoisospora suis]|uniref:Uncharacterized protein n=1 Tax=Cystoisospora suis TaxID=483139 RepID=A0A2C6KUW8_9APIC|nr:hypothetical protein CSUI_005529 [Cystoisospora suis]
MLVSRAWRLREVHEIQQRWCKKQPSLLRPPSLVKTRLPLHLPLQGRVGCRRVRWLPRPNSVLRLPAISVFLFIMRSYSLGTLLGCLLAPSLALLTSCMEFYLPYSRHDPLTQLARERQSIRREAARAPAWPPHEKFASLGEKLAHLRQNAQARQAALPSSPSGADGVAANPVYDPYNEMYGLESPLITHGHAQSQMNVAIPAIPGHYGERRSLPTSAFWLQSSTGRVTAALRSRLENLAQGLGSSQNEYKNPLDLLIEEFLVFVRSISRLVAMCQSSRTAALLPSSMFTSAAENSIIDSSTAERQANHVVSAARPVLRDAANLLNLLYKGPSESVLKEHVKQFAEKLQSLRDAAQNFRMQMQAIRGRVRSMLADCPILVKTMGKRNAVQDLWMKIMARINSIAKYVALAGEKLPSLLFVLLPAVHGSVQPESTEDFRLTDKVVDLSDLIDTIQSRANSSKSYNERLQKAISQLSISAMESNAGTVNLVNGEGPYGVLSRTGYFGDSLAGAGPMTMVAGRGGMQSGAGIFGASMGVLGSTAIGGMRGVPPFVSSVAGGIQGSAPGPAEYPLPGFGLRELQFSGQHGVGAPPQSLRPLLPDEAHSPTVGDTSEKPFTAKVTDVAPAVTTRAADEAFSSLGLVGLQAPKDHDKSLSLESLDIPSLSLGGSATSLRTGESLAKPDVPQETTSSAIARTDGGVPHPLGFMEPRGFPRLGENIAAPPRSGAIDSPVNDGALPAEAGNGVPSEKETVTSYASALQDRVSVPPGEFPVAQPAVSLLPEGVSLTDLLTRSPLTDSELPGAATEKVDISTSGGDGPVSPGAGSVSSDTSVQGVGLEEEDVSNDRELATLSL